MLSGVVADGTIDAIGTIIPLCTRGDAIRLIFSIYWQVRRGKRGWCSSQYGIFVELPTGKTHAHTRFPSHRSEAVLVTVQTLVKWRRLPMTVVVVVSRGPLEAARTGRRTRTFRPTSSTPRLLKVRAGAAARVWLARHYASARAHKVNIETFLKINTWWEVQKFTQTNHIEQ